MAKFPRKIADSVTEKITAAHRPVRSLKSLRVSEYSRPVAASIASRLTCRAAASPPQVSASAPRTGYSTGEPEKNEA